MSNYNIETCISYCEPDKAFMSSNERRWINKIRKLADKHPDEIKILREPENNDGFIYASFPPRWVKIRPPKAVNMTAEQRQERSERMRKRMRRI